MKLILIILTFFCLNTSYSKEISLCHGLEEYPPFIYSEKSKDKGLSIESIEYISSQIGFTIKWFRLPWKRCMSEIQKNNIDGSINVIYFKEREKFFRYPSKNNLIDKKYNLFHINYFLFTSLKSKLSWDGHKLNNQKYQIGSSLGYATTNLLKKLKVPYYESFDSDKLFSLLLHKKLDGVVTLKRKGENILHKLNVSDEIVRNPIPFFSNLDYMVFSHKTDPKVSKKFWNEIQLFKKSKKFKDLAKKYDYK